MQRFFMVESFFLLATLLFSVVPLLVMVWLLLKIQSIDSTLKEISRKLDRDRER